MFERIAIDLNAWRKGRESLALHAKTLTAYCSGKYPRNPTIGIGLAFQQGLLKARVLYQHAWCRDALQEGPIFLEAWKKASTQAKPIKNVRQFLYQPKDVLDDAMCTFQRAWENELHTTKFNSLNLEVVSRF